MSHEGMGGTVMSYADQIFKETIRNILENGVSDQNQEVRPKWEDGTPAHTLSVFGVVNRYDLSREFPIFTLRQSYWKSAWDEIGNCHIYDRYLDIARELCEK